MTLLEEQTVQLLKAFFSPSGLLSRHEIDSIETGLRALVEFQRETLELYYGKQLTFRGIAEGIPVTKKRRHCHGVRSWPAQRSH